MKKNALLCLLLTSYILGYSQSLNWTPIADFYTPRYEAYSFMIGDNLYVGSGVQSNSPMVIPDDLQEYDPSTDSWTAKTPIPGGLSLYGTNTFIINGNAYIIDGQVQNSSYNTTLWQYNPTSDSWTAKAPFPGSSGYTATSFSIGPYGFLGLGYPYITSFYCYNSITDSWSTIASYPGQANQGASAFVINGTAYVGAGGIQVGSNTFLNYNDFYKYDTISNQWSPIDSFPGVARRYGPCFSLNGKGYIIGGAGVTPGDIYNDVWQYDPSVNSWTQLDTFPRSIWAAVFGSNNSYAIAGLGQTASGSFPTTLWKTGKVTSITETTQIKPNVWCNSSVVNIKFQETLANNEAFSLYDISGKEITKITLEKGQSSFTLPFKQLSSGVYLYKIFSSSTQSENQNGKITILN